MPNGTSTCQKPGSGAGQCGAGIPAGAKLDFNLQYVGGSSIIAKTMNAEKSSWAQAGIKMNLSTASFSSVNGTAIPCTPGAACAWELQNWGSGWVFSPDYYPTGEQIFQTGAPSNSGGYSSATNDVNIVASTNTQVPLTTYENYLAEQLPVIFQPNYVTELHRNSKGSDRRNAAERLMGHQSGELAVEQLVAAEHDAALTPTECALTPLRSATTRRSSMMEAWAEDYIRAQGQRRQQLMSLAGPALRNALIPFCRYRRSSAEP